MKVNFSKLEKEVRRFQEGGQMPAEEAPAQAAPAPAEAAQADPMQLILQAAVQAVQTNDGQLALQVCAALVQLAQGGAAPAEQAEPVYRRGGRLAYRRK